MTVETFPGLQRLLELRAGGHVKRYHTEVLIGEQNVATHSFHMAVMALHFWPDSSHELLEAVLYHDLTEFFVGDVPAPAKRANQILWDALHESEDREARRLDIDVASHLDSEDTQRFLLMDALEACFLARDQVLLGNVKLGMKVFQNGCRYVMSHNPPAEIARTLDDLKTLIDAGL